ncbi:MAG TPA: imidazole glycerol phosphate synthase subunit HisH [Spirochaetota bacterium]|nr:imidazole glycerol phosphate synthase subunit HisH [Spirochaetota bacterium]
MIYILDYGAGNLKSAYHAFKSNHNDTVLIDHISRLQNNVTGLVLPGDGSFPYAYHTLQKRGFVSFLRQNHAIPLLGICVGFQLLFSASTEDGGCEGLNLIKGKVVRFEQQKPYKIPHMGWNNILLKQQTPCTRGITDHDYFYFVHSYYPKDVDSKAVLMQTSYISSFCAAVHKKNIYGFQFHPEKSHTKGMLIIKNFINICNRYQKQQKTLSKSGSGENSAH